MSALRMQSKWSLCGAVVALISAGACMAWVERATIEREVRFMRERAVVEELLRDRPLIVVEEASHLPGLEGGEPALKIVLAVAGDEVLVTDAGYSEALWHEAHWREANEEMAPPVGELELDEEWAEIEVMRQSRGELYMRPLGEWLLEARKSWTGRHERLGGLPRMKVHLYVEPDVAHWRVEQLVHTLAQAQLDEMSFVVWGAEGAPRALLLARPPSALAGEARECVHLGVALGVNDSALVEMSLQEGRGIPTFATSRAPEGFDRDKNYLNKLRVYDVDDMDELSVMSRVASHPRSSCHAPMLMAAPRVRWRESGGLMARMGGVERGAGVMLAAWKRSPLWDELGDEMRGSHWFWGSCHD